MKTIPPAHYCFIDAAMADNDELTASDLKTQLVKEFGEEQMTYSERTVSRACNDLGWTFTSASYCQAIHDPNKLKRVVWVNKCLEDQEPFKEFSFQMNVQCSFNATGQSRFARQVPHETEVPP